MTKKDLLIRRLRDAVYMEEELVNSIAGGLKSIILTDYLEDTKEEVPPDRKRLLEILSTLKLDSVRHKQTVEDIIRGLTA